MGNLVNTPTIIFENTKITESDVNNLCLEFSKITENLYVTCYKTARYHFSKYNDKSDEYVYIDVAKENIPLYNIKNKRDVFVHLANYYKFFWDDSSSQKLFPQIDYVADIIRNNIKSNKKVILYCVKGISRSASAAIYYIMKYYRYKFLEAYNYVSTKRRVVHPNSSFFLQLNNI